MKKNNSQLFFFCIQTRSYHFTGKTLIIYFKKLLYD